MNFSTGANLGDCCWVMQFLRTMGGSHAFYCKSEYIGQLQELMQGYDVRIEDVNNRPSDAIDTWIANAQFEEKGVFFRNQGDIIGFVIDYMNHVGGMCGTPAPVFTSREQFLFDLPRRRVRIPHFDILVVNAQPTSGQVPEFDNGQMNDLIGQLALHNSVICTNPTTAQNALVANCSIRRIGELAQHCGCIIGVATGPIWTTFNTANRSTPRHILLSPMALDYGPTVPIQNHANVASVEAAMHSEGWL